MVCCRGMPRVWCTDVCACTSPMLPARLLQNLCKRNLKKLHFTSTRVYVTILSGAWKENKNMVEDTYTSYVAFKWTKPRLWSPTDKLIVSLFVSADAWAAIITAEWCASGNRTYRSILAPGKSGRKSSTDHHVLVNLLHRKPEIGKAGISQRPQINYTNCNNRKTMRLSITEIKKPWFELCCEEYGMEIWISIAVNNMYF